MSMPGFTGQAGLGKPSKFYAAGPATPSQEGISPQQSSGDCETMLAICQGVCDLTPWPIDLFCYAACGVEYIACTTPPSSGGTVSQLPPGATGSKTCCGEIRNGICTHPCGKGQTEQ
jgi:hypothetical protein